MLPIWHLRSSFVDLSTYNPQNNNNVSFVEGKNHAKSQ